MIKPKCSSSKVLLTSTSLVNRITEYCYLKYQQTLEYKPMCSSEGARGMKPRWMQSKGCHAKTKLDVAGIGIRVGMKIREVRKRQGWDKHEKQEKFLKNTRYNHSWLITVSGHFSCDLFQGWKKRHTQWFLQVLCNKSLQIFSVAFYTATSSKNHLVMPPPVQVMSTFNSPLQRSRRKRQCIFLKQADIMLANTALCQLNP